MPHNSIPVKSYTNERDLVNSDAQDKQAKDGASNADLLSKKLNTINTQKNQSKEQFYRESYDIFLELRSCLEFSQSKTLKDPASRDRDLTSILSKYTELTHEYATAEKYTQIWDLCQRLYFPMENTNLLISLRDWINEYNELPNVGEARTQDKDEELEENNCIGPTWVWEYSRRHLLRGNFQESIDILSFSLDFLSKQQRHAVENIIGLIEGLDNVVSSIDNKIVFWENWAAWSDRCKKSKEEFTYAMESQDGDDEKNDEIYSLYSILVGDEDFISRSGIYFEVVLGTAWFVKPKSSLSNLKSLAQNVESALEDDTCSLACSYILMGEFDDVFDELGGDLWLHTHLGYALIITGNIVTETRTITNSVDEEAVLDPIYYSIQAYAQNIAEEFDMWEEAIIYLSCCQSNREIWVKQLLGDPILPSKEDERICSLLNIVNKCGLNQVKKYIHQGLGHRYEHEKKIRQATIEYGKADDLKSLDRLAHVEFSRYLKTGNLDDVVTDMDALNHSPHYAILILYCQFREQLSEKRWKEASQAVLRLLENEHLPTKFETVLLIDNLPILKESMHYYSADGMAQLINIFKQITKDPSNQDFIAKYYKFIEKHEYTSDVIIAKLRERLAYKAATAPAVC